MQQAHLRPVIPRPRRHRPGAPDARTGTGTQAGVRPAAGLARTGPATRTGTQTRRWRPHLTAANTITTASLLTGLAACWEAARAGTQVPDGRLRLVVAMIAACAVLDAVDGPLARRRGTAGKFGAELDSLADLTAFGIAPCLAFYAAALHTIPVAGALTAAGWCTAAAWRLARFSLCPDPDRFTGLPVPAAAVTVSAVLLAASPAEALATVAAASLLMISRVPLPTWHSVTASARSARLRRKP